MTARKALPPGLAGRPFLLGHALSTGVGRGRLQSSELARPFHGVRAPHDLDIAMSYSPRLRPGDRFSHTTAAQLWGVPLPTHAEGQLHVTSSGLDAVRARGVIGHESQAGSVIRWRGHPVSDPVSTYLELASLLAVDELVAVGDYLVLDPRVMMPGQPRPYASIDGLRIAATEARTRGVGRARRAAALVRSGVESPQETALRLLLIGAGLPTPECGYELRDDRARVGWFDLAWPQFTAIAEYDGNEHRTSTRQYDRDIQRYDHAADLGWRVVRVRSRGLGSNRAHTVERVVRALRQGGYVP